MSTSLIADRNNMLALLSKSTYQGIYISNQPLTVIIPFNEFIEFSKAIYKFYQTKDVMSLEVLKQIMLVDCDNYAKAFNISNPKRLLLRIFFLNIGLSGLSHIETSLKRYNEINNKNILNLQCFVDDDSYSMYNIDDFDIDLTIQRKTSKENIDEVNGIIKNMFPKVFSYKTSLSNKYIKRYKYYLCVGFGFITN